MEILCNLLPEDLARVLKEQGEPGYISKQILEWIYGKSVSAWSSMTNISEQRRAKFSKEFIYPCLEKVRVLPSDDMETYKFLWKMRDGSLVESVLICSGARRTVCVSSQVGCPAACAFCASGKQGFKRNLSAGEIVEQIIHINAWLAEKGETVSHVVFMGMGEPLKNYAPVVKAIKLISHPDLLNISQRRITVSTVGIVEGIKQLASEDLKVSLVLSLHAPNQHVRKKIIPYARKYPLEDIMKAMEDYTKKTKRDATYEYILISGINDHPDHAFELAELLKGKQCTVNLIPYNPVAGIRLERPSKKDVKAFRSVLFANRIVNTCRYTKGDDIAAACGQLALQENRVQEEKPKSPLQVLN